MAAMASDLDTADVPGGKVKLAYVREQAVPTMPAPGSLTGPVGWVRGNLLSGPFNIILTILCLLLIAWVVPAFIKFLFIAAAWSGTDRTACITGPDRPEVGACWPFVRERWAYFVYGSYPLAQRWRVDVFFAMLAVGVFW